MRFLALVFVILKFYTKSYSSSFSFNMPKDCKQVTTAISESIFFDAPNEGLHRAKSSVDRESAKTDCSFDLNIVEKFINL